MQIRRSFFREISIGAALFKVIGFVSIVAALFWVFYSLAGGTPLLVAKYDTPNDSRLVRGFFKIHYRFLTIIAGLGALSFALAENRFLAAAMFYEVALGMAALLFIVSRMSNIHESSAISNEEKANKFRKLISTALALNLANIATILWFVSQSTLITCIKTPPDCSLGQKVDGQPVPCAHVCSLF